MKKLNKKYGMKISIKAVDNGFQIFKLNAKKDDAVSGIISSIDEALLQAADYISKNSGGSPVKMTDPWGQEWQLGSRH